MTLTRKQNSRARFSGSIRARLAGIVALFAVALLAVVALLTWMEAGAIYTARQEQLKTVAQVAYKVIERQYDDFKSGKITEAEAQERAKANIRGMRYNTNDYFFVQNKDGITIVHGARPELEGIDTSKTLPPGARNLAADMQKVAVEQGQGFIDYEYAKPGAPLDQLSPKLAFVKSFSPWQWTLGTGVYIDDISVMVWRRIYVSCAIALAFLLVIGGFAGFVVLTLSRRLNALGGAMTSLATGQSDVQLPPIARDDEIDRMTLAVQVFKDNAVERVRLEAETAAHRSAAEAERARIEAERARAGQEQADAVRRLGEGLKSLASGDLRIRLDDGFSAQYAQIKDDFNEAAEKLKETMQAVVTSANALHSGTTEITTASDHLSQRTEQQAASLEETAAALDEITAMVKKSAEGTKHAREVVHFADQDAKKSAVVVRQAVEAMDAIAKSSRQISDIIGVIDEIAFQTNLLALNAGVEAARAGETGRGFAVVASEVRGLAQRSAEAAKEIKGLISTSATQVDIGVKLVAETGNSLERIIAQVAEINNVVVQIASGAQEQATGLQQVNSAINQMDQTTQQNATMVEESTATSHSLSQETTQLSSLINRFQLGQRVSEAALRGQLHEVAPHAFQKPPSKNFPAASRTPPRAAASNVKPEPRRAKVANGGIIGESEESWKAF